jgi:catechol 2,3-dioxygenase-like lactoylglutathione lyase family enzyme
MLGDHPIPVVLLAPDLDASQAFYANKIGVKVLTESPEAVSFQCGGDSQLDVTKSTVGTADSKT